MPDEDPRAAAEGDEAHAAKVMPLSFSLAKGASLVLSKGEKGGSPPCPICVPAQRVPRPSTHGRHVDGGRTLPPGRRGRRGATPVRSASWAVMMVCVTGSQLEAKQDEAGVTFAGRWETRWDAEHKITRYKVF